MRKLSRAAAVAAIWMLATNIQEVNQFFVDWITRGG